VTAFLTTERLTLGPLTPDDASDEYLAWLNDPEVLRYRGPKAFPSTFDDLRRYLSGISTRGDLALAIRLRDGGRHIGNVTLNSILWVHRSAELSMMIGARDVWGQRLGKEAIAAVTRHAFLSMGLHRVWAESPNPAFNASVRALGWTREGTKREAFLVDGKYYDVECWSILSDEFQRMAE
jgi:[ribosomal protein S5]-alanine N-acetyltransferase